MCLDLVEAQTLVGVLPEHAFQQDTQGWFQFPRHLQLLLTDVLKQPEHVLPLKRVLAACEVVAANDGRLA